MKRYLFHDFETGGYENTSILSYYGQITDETFKKIREIELYFEPDDGIYKIEVQALKYNKIDLVQHAGKARKCADCKNQIENFLWSGTDGSLNKLYAAGHNVYWDNAHLESIIGKDAFRRRFHRHLLDTAGLALVLQLKGKLPEHFEISLGNLAEFFQVNPLVCHEAKADVETTIAILKQMMKEI